MASKNQSQDNGFVMGADDGFLKVRSLEDGNLDAYLSTYAARIEGYQVRPGEKATNITMKISFPTCEKESNANMWAWFIAKAAHPTAAKPTTRTVIAESGFVVYVSWPIWSTVKYMESKREGFTGF